LQALGALPAGEGSVIVVRQWAAETREVWRLREGEWAQIPVVERERMIIGHKLRDWQAALDIHKAEAEAEAKNGG
jgi:hypothetical protein